MDGQAILPMTPALAEEIAGWRYPAPYHVYNWGEEDPLDELLDGSTYAVQNLAGDLVGFYQFGAGARVPTVEESPYPDGPMDMGLGLHPELCGLGLGKAFLLAGMRFAREKLGAPSLRLTVADFNLRARKVYESCGFSPIRRVTHQVSGDGFIVMGTQGLQYRNAISTEDYCRLRAAVGWSPIPPEQAGAGLAGSACVVGCYDGEKAVGSARLLWDGGYEAHLTNVMVLPAYQGLGIGTSMVERCMLFLRLRLRPGWRFKVHLRASGGTSGFYEQFGFTAAPGESAGQAMDMWME
ncbi:GNAT family N-acetyltransferase [Acutalibacter caecimuris]|uniref:GNAT family N-acetyltransferase n=1 Tax=Acutalibacter caecimuris TaxID=3093657 RepID=UPI002AC9B1C2|nr:GNAT family N-acetyltransferase [Acutalibacter sp. M00118]